MLFFKKTYCVCIVLPFSVRTTHFLILQQGIVYDWWYFQGETPKLPEQQCCSASSISLYGNSGKWSLYVNSRCTEMKILRQFGTSSFEQSKYGILLSKLFWPTERKNCSSDPFEKIIVKTIWKIKIWIQFQKEFDPIVAFVRANPMSIVLIWKLRVLANIISCMIMASMR